jgi:hypothetical protein
MIEEAGLPNCQIRLPNPQSFGNALFQTLDRQSQSPYWADTEEGMHMVRHYYETSDGIACA